MTNQCTWHAVTVELENIFVERYSEYGYSTNGNLYRVDGYINGVPVSVISKFGEALRAEAETKATKVGGVVHTIKSQYMFNNSDISELTFPK